MLLSDVNREGLSRFHFLLSFSHEEHFLRKHGTMEENWGQYPPEADEAFVSPSQANELFPIFGAS